MEPIKIETGENVFHEKLKSRLKNNAIVMVMIMHTVYTNDIPTPLLIE